MCYIIDAMTARDLLISALSLPEADRVKLAAELLASVAPGEVVSGTAWERAWLTEIENRETLEPDETDEQRKLLADRWERHQANPDEARPWSEVRAELEAKYRPTE